jgi:Asp-tRNA(Asn)/Glu-tRNA(Gln) amidotransferase C subunit
MCYILEIKGVVMVGLSNQEVQALGRAVGLDIQEPELSQVAHSLNAIRELMEEIDAPGVNAVEPLPIILPQGEV